MGNMAKQKGKRGEIEASTLLGLLLGKSNAGADQVFVDVQANNADIISLAGLSIEVKRQETLALGTWWRQALRQAEASGTIPVLMYRQNRRAWRFCLPAYLLVVEAEGYIEMDVAVFGVWLNKWVTK